MRLFLVLLLVLPVAAGQMASQEVSASVSTPDWHPTVEPEAGTAQVIEAPHETAPGGYAGFATAGAGLGLAFLAWLFRTPLVLGFTRLRRSDLLDQPSRRRIYDAVSEAPGIHLKAVVRRCGLANGATRHHLDVLCRAGLLTERAEMGYRCYTVAGTPARGRSALRARMASDAYSLIATNPGWTAAELARELGTTAGNIAHHLRRLEAATLAQELRLRGRREWHPARMVGPPGRMDHRALPGEA